MRGALTAGGGPQGGELRDTSGVPEDRRRNLIIGSWERHRDLVGNVLTLLGTTGTSLILGFAYWDIAARLFSQQAVGYGSAAISAMTLLSSFGTFGLNTLLVGDLPNRRKRAGLIFAAMLAAAIGSCLLALGFVALVPHFTKHYNDVASSVGGVAVFCTGVALSAASIVFDAATIGVLRGGLQLTRNMAFVVAKMLTLICVALVFHYTLGIGILASWVAALPVGLLVVGIRLQAAGAFSLPRPDWHTLRSLRGALAAHNWLNLSLQVPGLLIPVVAASIFPPATNAAYYIALTIAGGLFILPAHMSTVLFAMGAANPAALPRRLRFALRSTLLFGGAGVAVLGLGAPWILRVFGAGYAGIAALPMRIMVVAFLPDIFNYFYIAVARARNTLAKAASVMTTFAVLDVAAVGVGALTHGLIGMASGDLVVVTVWSLFTAPVVLHAAMGAGRHRRALETQRSSPAIVTREKMHRWYGPDILRSDVGDGQVRQLDGLAVLMSMARPATATMLAVASDSERVSGPDRRRAARNVDQVAQAPGGGMSPGAFPVRLGQGGGSRASELTSPALHRHEPTRRQAAPRVRNSEIRRKAVRRWPPR